MNVVRAATEDRIALLLQTIPTNRLLVLAGIVETIAHLDWVAATAVLVERRTHNEKRTLPDRRRKLP
jgi:hypothetical protein